MKDKGRSDVKNALVNILAFPGMGSLRSGRWVAGIGQLFFALTGTALVLVWFYKEVSLYYGLMFGDEKPQAIGWIGETGGVLFGIAWLWACVTSLSLFRQASQPAAAPPPILPMPKKKPTNAKIEAAMADLPDWQCDGEVISRTYEFEDFPPTMEFVNAVANVAEKAQHHPDIDVRWNKVTLAFTTHDAGGLTDKDFKLARQCDGLSIR